MSDGITIHCVRCGKFSALKKEYDSWKGIDVYTCQEKDCGKIFACEVFLVRSNSSPPVRTSDKSDSVSQKDLICVKEENQK